MSKRNQIRKNSGNMGIEGYFLKGRREHGPPLGRQDVPSATPTLKVMNNKIRKMSKKCQCLLQISFLFGTLSVPALRVVSEPEMKSCVELKQ